MKSIYEYSARYSQFSRGNKRVTNVWTNELRATMTQRVSLQLRYVLMTVFRSYVGHQSLPADGTQSTLRVTVTQGGSPHLRYVRIDNNVNGSYAGHVRRPMMTSGHSLTPGQLELKTREWYFIRFSHFGSTKIPLKLVIVCFFQHQTILVFSHIILNVFLMPRNFPLPPPNPARHNHSHPRYIC